MKLFFNIQSFLRVVLVLAFCLVFGGTASWAHSAWKQRNEPGPWTVCLYHCDETELTAGSELMNAGWNREMDLVIEDADAFSLESTIDVKYSFFDRAISAYEFQPIISSGTVLHPTGDMSIELWMRFLEAGADVKIGFQDGVSLHIRIGGDGDRFQLIGKKLFEEDGVYSAPDFISFPPAGSWHHYGVTIHAPSIQQLDDEIYLYQEGCYAQFFYDSHVVGLVNNTKLDLQGFTFSARSKVSVEVMSGAFVIDEVMVSNVDWSDPVGHGGEGHGSVQVGHAFEDGRRPATDVADWPIF